MPADAGPPEAARGTPVRKGGVAWYLGVGFLVVCWVLLLAESVNGARYDFASTFDRGWVCGQGTLGLLLLLPIALFIVAALLVVSGRADLGFAACAALGAAARLGEWRGSRTVFCVLFFGAAAVLLLVPAVLAFRRNRRETGRLRRLGAAFAVATGVGIAGHLGWAPDLDAVFRERAGAAVRELRYCLDHRLPVSTPAGPETIEPPAAPASREGLSPALAACSATGRGPQWKGRTFALRETATEVVGEVLFRYRDRDYRHAFRFPMPAGPDATESPANGESRPGLRP
jgi:hypothetical protein